MRAMQADPADPRRTVWSAFPQTNLRQSCRRAGIVAVLLLSGCVSRPPAPSPSYPPSSTSVRPDGQPAPITSAPDTPPIDSRLQPARDALARQDYISVLRALETARSQGAPRAALLETQADLFKATGYLDREIATLRDWTKVRPTDHRPWIKLFHIYLDLGWRAEAREASDQAIRLKAEDPRSQITRALYYYRSNDAIQGVAAMEAARRLAPDKPEYANLQAALLVKAKRYAEADALLRGLLAQKPDSIPDSLLLAQVLIAQEKMPEAEATLQGILKQSPGNIDARYHLGLLAQKRGDFAAATRFMQQVVQQDRGYSNALFVLGRLYTRQGRVEEGRQLLQTYKTMEDNTGRFETLLSRLQTRANDPELHYQLAKQRLAAEELPQAIVELRRTLELRPKDRKARAELIAALKRHGRATEAQQLAAEK